MSRKKVLSLQEKELPYWPSEAFINESLAMLREKGVDDSDENLTEHILRAYRHKRAEILANEAMETYEKA